MSFFTQASFVMDPAVYNAGTLFVPKPTDGSGDLTFTRSSGATRIGPNGYIEKVRTNLLLQSNTFSTTWTSGGLSETIGQTGYDGTSNAWLIENLAGGARFLSQTFSSGGYAFSIYAKAGNVNLVALNNGAGATTYFNLSTGAIGTNTGTIDAKIESVGSGWYRVSMAFASGNEIRVYPVSTDGSLSTAIGSTIVVQDAQLEVGLVATDYIPTTTTAVSVGPVANIPRLNYDSTGCASLLLEPQRTNLLSQSEYYDTTPYSKVNVSVTHNDSLSPEGVVNGAKLESNSSGSASRVETFPTLTDNTNYTASIFAKQGNVDFIFVNFRDKNNNQHGVYFNLSTGQKGTSVGTPIDSSIETVGGYYRCSIVFDSSSGGTAPRLQYLVANTDNNVVTASGDYIYIYGAQLEAGTYATSYIPTLGSAVTRNADACFKTGASSFIGQQEGTLFLEVDAVNFETDQRFAISDGTSANRIALRMSAGGVIQLSVVIGSTTQASISGSGSVGNTYKIAGAYKANDFVLYINGILAATDTSGSVSGTFSRLATDNGVSGQDFYNPIKQALIFKTRLSNADLARLTSI